MAPNFPILTYVLLVHTSMTRALEMKYLFVQHVSATAKGPLGTMAVLVSINVAMTMAPVHVKKDILVTNVMTVMRDIMKWTI